MEPDPPVIKDIPLGYKGKYGNLLRQLENAPPGKAIVVKANTFAGCSPHAALRIKKRVGRGMKLCVRNRCDGIYLWLEPKEPKEKK